jgi:predicted transcriptional regulator
MSSSANLELPNDSIRGSDVKKILRRIEIVVENQLQHQKDLEQLKNQARPNGTINHPTVTEIQGLPLQTMAELEHYEISLRDEEVRRQLVI